MRAWPGIQGSVRSVVGVAHRHVVRTMRAHAEAPQREAREPGAVAQDHAQVIDGHRLGLGGAMDVHELGQHVADVLGLQSGQEFFILHRDSPRSSAGNPADRSSSRHRTTVAVPCRMDRCVRRLWLANQRHADAGHQRHDDQVGFLVQAIEVEAADLGELPRARSRRAAGCGPSGPAVHASRQRVVGLRTAGGVPASSSTRNSVLPWRRQRPLPNASSGLPVRDTVGQRRDAQAQLLQQRRCIRALHAKALRRRRRCCTPLGRR